MLVYWMNLATNSKFKDFACKTRVFKMDKSFQLQHNRKKVEKITKKNKQKGEFKVFFNIFINVKLTKEKLLSYPLYLYSY